MATILQRLGSLERAVAALAGRTSVLETKQAGDDEQDVLFDEALASLRTDLTALAELVGTDQGGELPTPEDAFEVEITGEVKTQE